MGSVAFGPEQKTKADGTAERRGRLGLPSTVREFATRRTDELDQAPIVDPPRAD